MSVEGVARQTMLGPGRSEPDGSCQAPYPVPDRDQPTNHTSPRLGIRGPFDDRRRQCFEHDVWPKHSAQVVAGSADNGPYSGRIEEGRIGASNSMTNQQTVLVVDDDPSTLLICRKTLERDGFRVLQAAGSSEALKIFMEKSGFIDVLLTDLLLPPPDFQLATVDNRFPRVHGHEVIARVLDMKQSFHIVCMSAATMGELIHHGMQLEGMPFLQKPFTADQLLRAIRDALTGQPVVRRNLFSISGQKDVSWYD